MRGYQRHLARLRTGPQGARRPLAISTRSRRLVALRSLLRFAAREEWLPGDLGTTIDVPKLPERLPKPLEAGDRDRLLEALPHETLAQQRDRALILLLLSTGARISEILRLDRSEWKPQRMWVVGKGDRERVVQVTDKARVAVEDYLDAREDESEANRGRLHGELVLTVGVGGAGVAPFVVVGEGVVEDAGADLEEQVGAVGCPAHLLFFDHAFFPDYAEIVCGSNWRSSRTARSAAASVTCWPQSCP